MATSYGRGFATPERNGLGGVRFPAALYFWFFGSLCGVGIMKMFFLGVLASTVVRIVLILVKGVL